MHIRETLGNMSTVETEERSIWQVFLLNFPFNVLQENPPSF